MELPLLVQLVGLIIGVVTLIVVYFELRELQEATRAQVLSSLVSETNQSDFIQQMLRLVYFQQLETNKQEDRVRIIDSDSGADVTEDVDKLLNRFQLIGHIRDLGTLRFRDVQGLRYEILSIGRNDAIFEYLNFLGSSYQDVSDIQHNHFLFFKRLYVELEYEELYRDRMSRLTLANPRPSLSARVEQRIAPLRPGIDK